MEEKSASIYLWGETWPNCGRRLEQLDLVRVTGDRSDICVLGFPRVYANTHTNIKKNAHHVRTVCMLLSTKKCLLEKLIIQIANIVAVPYFHFFSG